MAKRARTAEAGPSSTFDQHDDAEQPSTPAPSGDSDLAQLLAGDEDEGGFMLNGLCALVIVFVCRASQCALVGIYLMLAVRADAGTKHEPSSQPQADAAAASAPGAADAGDDDWALSEDDGADDEATLDAEELAALADGVNVKVGCVLCVSELHSNACNFQQCVHSPAVRRSIALGLCSPTAPGS